VLQSFGAGVGRYNRPNLVLAFVFPMS